MKFLVILGVTTKAFTVLKKSDMNISKVAHKLMMGYPSVYHVMKEYEWFIKHNIDPFSDIQHKKRLSKESMKEIQEFVLKSKNSFAIKDLIVAVKEKANKDVKDYDSGGI